MRRLFVLIAVALLAIGAGAAAIVALPAIAVAGGAAILTGAFDVAANETAERVGFSSDEIRVARSTAAQGVPWPVALVLVKQYPQVLLAAVDRALDVSDPDGAKRDLTIGTVYSASTGSLVVPTAEADQKAAREAEQLRTMNISALEAAGLTNAQATSVYGQALRIALGAQIVCGPTVVAPVTPIPTATSPTPTATPPPKNPTTFGVCGGQIAWPLPLGVDGITPIGHESSAFGWRSMSDVIEGAADQFHSGLDIAVPDDTPVYAIQPGIVTSSGQLLLCGGYVRVQHPDGTSTGYLHLNEQHVQRGDSVEAGQQIGLSGGNQPGGCTFGGHLHLYACTAEGLAEDPVGYLERLGFVLPEAWTSVTALPGPLMRPRCPLV